MYQSYEVSLSAMKKSHLCIHNMEKEAYKTALWRLLRGKGWKHPLRHEKSTAHVFAKFGPLPGFFAGQVAEHDKIVADMFPTRFGYDTFPDWITEDKRWNQHLEFTRKKLRPQLNRGGGYWFWKPLLIQRALDEGYQWVIYSDVDRQGFAKWTKQAMRVMERRNATLAIERTAGTEEQYSHPVTQEAICGRQLKDRQYNANLIILKNTPNTRNMIDDWVNYSANFTLLSIRGLEQSNIKDHRYDQTLMSLTVKCQYHERGMEPMPPTCNQRKLTSFQI